MVKEKVGREDWKQLKVGETGVFTLPDERALESARVAALSIAFAVESQTSKAF